MCGMCDEWEKARGNFLTGSHPQIVISDIRMPGTDGLELTRQIKEKDKETVVILLSAYRDFDYAQKGIRYGVSNYLLKHELSSELILKELEEVKEKLERAGNKKKIYQKYFMNQLIYHRVTAEELDKSILGNRFFLLLLHKRNPVIQGEFAETRWTEEEQEAVRNILEESLENIVFYAADVQITENNWILLYRIENTASKYMVNSLILRKCHQIADQLEGMLKSVNTKATVSATNDAEDLAKKAAKAVQKDDVDFGGTGCCCC